MSLYKTLIRGKLDKERSFDPTEKTYAGKYVYIPELKSNIKIANSSTLKEWVINYCRTHLELRPILFTNYNITEDDIQSIKTKRSLRR